MASIIKVDAIQTTAGKPIVNSTGGVLQVISSTKTNAYTDNETSLTDIPGTDQDGNGSVWCAKITPSSTSSRVFIMLHTSVSASDAGAGLILFRNATQIYKGDASGSNKNRFSLLASFGNSSYPTPYYGGGISHLHYLDSPNLTSEITYKFQVKIRANSYYINQTNYDVDNDNASRTPSSLTLMEIA